MTDAKDVLSRPAKAAVSLFRERPSRKSSRALGSTKPQQYTPASSSESPPYFDSEPDETGTAGLSSPARPVAVAIANIPRKAAKLAATSSPASPPSSDKAAATRGISGTRVSRSADAALHTDGFANPGKEGRASHQDDVNGHGKIQKQLPVDAMFGLQMCTETPIRPGRLAGTAPTAAAEEPPAEEGAAGLGARLGKTGLQTSRPKPQRAYASKDLQEPDAPRDDDPYSMDIDDDDDTSAARWEG